MSGRIPAKAAPLAVAVLLAWITAEGFSSSPIIPVRGDVPTIGHGATHYEDGTRVTMSDPPITRARARELAANLLDQQYAQCVRDSLGDTLVHPEGEFATAVDFAGQYGCGAWRASSMRRDLVAGEYARACRGFLAYKFMTSPKPLQGFAPHQWARDGRPTRWRFDCSTPGNRVCLGVWTRQLARHADCMAVQA